MAAAHPVAVAIAKDLRRVFGDGVRLTYAQNKLTGATLGGPGPIGAAVVIRKVPSESRLTGSRRPARDHA